MTHVKISSVTEECVLKWKCVLLVFAILLSGMYLNRTTADTGFFVPWGMESGEAHLFVEESVSENHDICTTEQLGEREIGETVSLAKRTASNSCIRTVYLLLSLAVLPEKSIYRAKNKYGVLRKITGRRDVIIGYIHCQDGGVG